MDNKKVMGVALGALLAGAVAGVLLAPKSGAETREDLKNLADKMKDQLTEKMAKMAKVTKTAYNEMVHNVVQQYEDAKEITAEQASDLKEQLGESYDRVKEAARDEGMDVADDMEDAAA